MSFVKVVSPARGKAKKAAPSEPAGKTMSRATCFSRVCRDFDKVSELTKSGLKALVQLKELNELHNFVELGGSAAALYVAFHSEVAHSIGFETSTLRLEQVGEWEGKLNKVFPGVFSLRALDTELTEVVDFPKILRRASIIFCNTAYIGIPAFIEMLPALETRFQKDTILVVTSNPWPRPSKFHPAPFKLFKRVDIDQGSNVGTGQLTLFCFQHLQGKLPSEFDQEQLDTAPRARRMSDFVFTPVTSTSSRSSGSSKKTASTASRISASTVTDSEDDTLPPPKTRSKRARADDTDGEMEAPVHTKKPTTVKSPTKAKIASSTTHKTKAAHSGIESPSKTQKEAKKTATDTAKSPKSAKPAPARFNSPPPQPKLASPTKKKTASATPATKAKAAKAKSTASTPKPQPRKIVKHDDGDSDYAPPTDVSQSDHEMQVDETPAPSEAQPQTWGSWVASLFRWGN